MYSPCVPQGMSYCSISATEATDFSPRVGVIMNLKRFNVLVDNKLSIITLYLFFPYFLLKKTSSSSLGSYIITKEKYRKSKQLSLR